MIKVNVVSLEETSYFTPREEDRSFIRAIHSVYAYNPEEETHCCELTPSYDLRFLYSYIVGTEKMTDDMRDLLSERYCLEGGVDMYMWCSRVQKLQPKECGEFEDMDEAVEYLRGNWPI